MESFNNGIADHYHGWDQLDPELQQAMATQDLLDDTTLIFPEVDTPSFDADADEALRNLFGSDLEDLQSLLAQPKTTTELTTHPSVISPPTPALTRVSTEALRVLDPSLRIPEEVLPMGHTPSVELLPRGRSRHQYNAQLQLFGSRALDEDLAPYDNQDQPSLANYDYTSQQTGRDHASQKRKASTSLGGASKVRKTLRMPTTGSNNRITSTTPKHAPQAAALTRAVPPPSASDDQFALPQGLYSRRASTSAYGQHTLERPPPNVCLPLDVELGLVELMTFFPNSVQIPLLAIRLVRNGFSYQTLAKMQLDPVNELTDKSARTVEDKIKWQFKDGGGCEWPDKKAERTMWQRVAQSEGPHHNLTANHFKLRHEYSDKKPGRAWGHWKLADIYSAVDESKWPQGDDRMVLTQCLEFARDNPQLDLDTSHWDWIIQVTDAQPPAFPTGYITRDEEVLERCSALYPTRQALRLARNAKRAGKK
ncbi:hypothetical protein M409DRAFT_59659 [Zasmidium cellare ATCC 36951]|uniref:Uncharacterized protein n=1 Tax=Zasmidium cellare ATCC 36951 TaxID=1080233 RepID=A0A6A6C670_ZASCE|nr:uncharacterized protein M409DRAFT_59659 [Zasmidium cellare ATCC 36951]KAF2160876.1 hypothetical protein M409DRAFT_59659 [Zasmidium cellare ATCC 36951]